MITDEETPREPREDARTLIGARTAALLYAGLVVFAFATLKGKPLALALIIVGGLAAKSFLHWLREKSGV